MHNLTLFEAMLTTHFVMDWIFQRKWEEMNKDRKWIPLIVHCLIYTFGFIFVFWWYEINFLWLVLIFFSHLVLDRKKFVYWILEKMKDMKKEETPEFLWQMFLIGTDQILHFIVLAAVVVFS